MFACQAQFRTSSTREVGRKCVKKMEKPQGAADAIPFGAEQSSD